MNKRQGQMLGSGAGAMGLAEAGYILYIIVRFSKKNGRVPKWSQLFLFMYQKFGL